jgi:hypothetical protein
VNRHITDIGTIRATAKQDGYEGLLAEAIRLETEER